MWLYSELLVTSILRNCLLEDGVREGKTLDPTHEPEHCTVTHKPKR